MKRDSLCAAVRERLIRLPAPYDAHYGVIPLPPPEQAVDVMPAMRQLSEAQAALGQVEALAGELHDPWLISRILPRQEAVSSSAIEGTHSTLDALLSLEETEPETAQSTAKQVRDYALALDAFVPEARKQGYGLFTTALVRALHQSVMQEAADYPDAPGELRSRVVWIGGRGDIAYSSYNPPPPDHVPACLEASMAYMRSEGMQVMTQGLVTRMAIAHAHFEAVHPFRDGNGRVGRLLWPLMMAAEGCPPLYLSPYIAEHKEAYYAALKAAQQQLLWHPLVAFISEAITGTVRELFATRHALQQLTEHWATRRAFRKGSAAARALAFLPHYPIITTKRLAQLAEVSIPAAATAIDQLMEVGILHENTGYTRNRIFTAHEVLRIVNRPFGEEVG
jgi:Fic family protein